jgi:carboxymethylenebutenolidase
MKTNLKYSLCIVMMMSLFVFAAKAQSKMSCCAMPSSVEFAMLSKDASFVASHADPLPFRFIPAKGKMVTIKTRDGKESSAFEVRADKATNNYLLVIHEWWGLNDYIKQEAEKLQGELGNVNVIALDLYDGRVAMTADSAAKIMGEAKEERIRAIIGGAIDYAGKDAKIQTIGWCFGGGWSLQASLIAGKQGTGCVMYYGMPEKDAAKLKTLNAPVLGLFASKDEWITPAVVSQFEKDMKTAGKEITVKSFAADHGFANPSNPHYDKAAGDEAHGLAVGFLKKHL